MTQTFETLHKDVKLVRTAENKYDRDHVNGDFVKVEGIDSLRNGITVALETWFGELDANLTYYQWGNKAWYVLKDNKTELRKTQLRDYLRECVASMRRIKSVDSITVTDDYNGDVYKVQCAISCTSIDDTVLQEVVVIGV